MLYQPEEIMAAVGYTNPSDYPLEAWDNLLYASHVVLVRLSKLMARLEGIEEALVQAAIDSMAMKVDKLEVNYASHMSILKAEGSRILEEIAFTIGTSVKYNRYSPKASKPITSFTSYW